MHASEESVGISRGNGPSYYTENGMRKRTGTITKEVREERARIFPLIRLEEEEYGREGE